MGFCLNSDCKSPDLDHLSARLCQITNLLNSALKIRGQGPDKYIYCHFILSFNYVLNKLWTESLDSDGQQFHKYQQNKKSPFTLTHRTQNRPQHIMLEIQVLAWDKHNNVAGLNQLMGSLPSPHDNWISNRKIYINKQ